jgi:hypothetical protein
MRASSKANPKSPKLATRRKSRDTYSTSTTQDLVAPDPFMDPQWSILQLLLKQVVERLLVSKEDFDHSTNKNAQKYLPSSVYQKHLFIEYKKLKYSKSWVDEVLRAFCAEHKDYANYSKKFDYEKEIIALQHELEKTHKECKDEALKLKKNNNQPTTAPQQEEVPVEHQEPEIPAVQQ